MKRIRNLGVTLALATLVVAGLLVSPALAAAPEGLWDTSVVPPCIANGSGPCAVADYGSLELGVKFQTSRPIDIVGVRFYRADSGTWSGSLWNAGGTWITSGNDSTTGPGWQTVMFASPQSMGSGDTFIASYFAPGGEYAFEWDYFTASGRTVDPVTALGGAGVNGLFNYSPTSTFPTTTFRDTNYWVTPLWVEQDTTPPEITITTPNDGATYLLNQNVAADYMCTDDVDPSPSCIGTVADGSDIDTASTGSKSFTVDAEDASGNPASLTHHYSVTYGFAGFFSPVDNNLLNIAKAGQSIPLKFRLTDAAGTPVTDVSGVTVTASSLNCSLGSTPDLLEEYAAGSSGLQNMGDGYYQFNWKTPKAYAGSCKTVSLTLADGVSHQAQFKFTK